MKFKQATLAVVVATVFGINASAVAANTDHPAVQRALTLLQGNGVSALAAGGEQWTARDVVLDADGSEHVRFDRQYKGLRVIGGDVVVHMKDQGKQLMAHSLTQQTGMQLDTRAWLDEFMAVGLAEMQFRGARNGQSKAELVVYARSDKPQMAYDVKVTGDLYDGTPSESHFIIDANTAQLLDRWDDIETAASQGTGNTIYGGAITLTTDSQAGGYALRDPGRGNHYVNNMANKTSGNGSLFTDSDNIWGNGSNSNVQSAGADVQYGQNLTWDYYKNVHGRNGIANDGKGGYSRAHYGSKYVNAFWSDSCFCMTYGDGDGVTYGPLVNIDVAGHEMSHGVTSRTANLTYSGESGGLNEGTSDIMGTMVEFYANNPKEPGNYLIGERIYLSNPSGTKALRYMFKPSLDGRSPDCYTSTIGNLNVHYSSGVANHFYYLLAEGAVVPAGFGSGTSFNLTPASLVCNGNTAISGIGRTAASKIWYRALTTYMTSNTNYSGARTATLNAASDLYGKTSSQYNTVLAAWAAVSVK
ncbi:M4 family metallopeptidase [Chitinimonas sp.]|uniref:M4 family metallopeptidase n=1 Tax=Chitinimonas sp. TaxID=1934313 RepID=UPI0035B10AA2